jgi:hypothetical protein
MLSIEAQMGIRVISAVGYERVDRNRWTQKYVYPISSGQYGGSKDPLPFLSVT